jgi:hypothetical protein
LSNANWKRYWRFVDVTARFPTPGANCLPFHAEKANPNDADRLRKYLARFGLSWENIRPAT